MTDPEFRALREVLRDVDRADLELLFASAFDTLHKLVAALGVYMAISPVPESMTLEETDRANELMESIAEQVAEIVRRRN